MVQPDLLLDRFKAMWAMQPALPSLRSLLVRTLIGLVLAGAGVALVQMRTMVLGAVLLAFGTLMLALAGAGWVRWVRMRPVDA